MFNPLFEILGIALAVSFLTNYLRRRLIGPEEMAKMKEAQEFQKKLLQAQKKGDKKLIQRLKKRQEYYQKISAEIGKKNMILMFISLGIFYAVFMALTPLYGSVGVVASLPSDLMIPFISQGNKLTFIGWYILALLATGMPMGKIFEVKSEEVESYAKKSVKDEK
ncbi:MAG TPA: DUF106 domain-containing protein [Nitrososphaeria archaeon]|nr:DUF106 domain-containing protein [Nitrososphaeria archaeon]